MKMALIGFAAVCSTLAIARVWDVLGTGRSPALLAFVGFLILCLIGMLACAAAMIIAMPDL